MESAKLPANRGMVAGAVPSGRTARNVQHVPNGVNAMKIRNVEAKSLKHRAAAVHESSQECLPTSLNHDSSIKKRTGCLRSKPSNVPRC